MKNESNQTRKSRRGFFRAAFAAVAGIGLFKTVEASIEDGKETANSEQSEVKSQGYRETEHVRTYYKKARF